MDKNPKYSALFILIVLVQIFIPARMIYKNEMVIKQGTEYKFRVAPIDPYDPYRGKYITMSFMEGQTTVPDENKWSYGDEVYVELEEDEDGFAKIRHLTKSIPDDNEDFVKAKVRRSWTTDSNNVIVDYPFKRFYLNESKALPAEKLYRETLRDTSQVIYALVSIRDGEGVLKDVMVNGIPIKTVVEKSNNK